MPANIFHFASLLLSYVKDDPVVDQEDQEDQEDPEAIANVADFDNYREDGEWSSTDGGEHGKMTFYL